MIKVFKVSDIKELEKQVSIGMISYTRMVEIMNELAQEAHSKSQKSAIPIVSDCFSFAKYLGQHFEYSDNTKDGDTYTDRDEATYTEADIYDEWLNNR